MTQDDIPIVEKYRGVGIHDCQTRERIDTVVRPAIAAVFEISAPDMLFVYLQSAGNPPEARLFALAKLTALGEAQRAGHHRAASTSPRPRLGPRDCRPSGGATPTRIVHCSTRWAAPRIRDRRSSGCCSWPPKGRADGRRRALALSSAALSLPRSPSSSRPAPFRAKRELRASVAGNARFSPADAHLAPPRLIGTLAPSPPYGLRRGINAMSDLTAARRQARYRRRQRFGLIPLVVEVDEHALTARLIAAGMLKPDDCAPEPLARAVEKIIADWAKKSLRRY